MSDLAWFVISTLKQYSASSTMEVSADTPIDILKMDSLSTLEAVMVIEDHFGIELDPAQFSSCHTVADVVALVAKARPA